MIPKTLIKSLGHSEPFDINKLKYAINLALNFSNEALGTEILNHVLDQVKDKTTTSTRYINDIIESYLIRNNHITVLQEYIANRLTKNKEYSDKVNLLGTRLVTSPDYDRGELQDFSVNQIQIAANRYLQHDMETGDIIESMTGWFHRVASHVVLGSVVYDPMVYDKEARQKQHDTTHIENSYFGKDVVDYLSHSQVEVLKKIYLKLDSECKMKSDFNIFIMDIDILLGQSKYQNLYRTYFQYMYEGIFEPNTPTLMNAGTSKPLLHACFVLDIKDTMKDISRIWSDASLIYKGAGGLGVNISNIRPKGDNVGSTFGAATGPISLVLEMIDKVTDVVKSGGKRRGANMGIMNSSYPMIEEFITMKKTPGYLENFNVSVLFDSDFWKAYSSGTDYELKFADKVYSKINPITLMENIAVGAWTSAEPGVLFRDNFNKKNPLKQLRGDIVCTNPCGEQAMYDGESCTLGSINLSKLIRVDGKFDWDRYVEIIHETTRFLNDVLETGMYPTEHIEEESLKTRRIGLGIMGLADLFFKLKIPYASQEGFWMMEELSKTLYVESVKTSIDLAEERGACYWYNEMMRLEKRPIDAVLRVYGISDNEPIDITLSTEYFEKLEKFGVRNMWTTTVAPTGTISMIADCSSGLEPVFSLVFSKITNAGKYYYTSELFKQALIERGIYSQALIEKVEKNYGSCQGIEEIPEDIQKVFVTAMDLHWIDHVVAQSVWQNWIDVSISKTINMPYNVTVEDVKNSYILAHEVGLKGIALFRDGSRNEQVLHVGSNVQSNKNEQSVQKDVSGTKTISAPTRNQVERNIKPSNYSMEYIKERINEQLLQDLTQHVEKTSSYLEQGEECPNCSKTTLINEGGCSSCKSCGYASCSVA